MKRRNFISGVLASPLALKARFLALFQKRPVEPCGATVLEWSAAQAVQPARGQSLTPRQREVVQLLSEGKSMKEAAAVLKPTPRTVARRTDRKHVFYCSLPRGHKGPHTRIILLNPR